MPAHLVNIAGHSGAYYPEVSRPPRPLAKHQHCSAVHCTALQIHVNLQSPIVLTTHHLTTLKFRSSTELGFAPHNYLLFPT